MILDDIIYLALLFVCMACGPLILGVPDIRQQQLLSTLVGIVVVFIVSGCHIIHPLIVTFVNAFIVLNVNKRKCHFVSFCFCFSYLILFRLMHYFGLPSPPPHTNAVQMILTLKMVGLAYEVHLLHLLESSKDESSKLKLKYSQIEPTLFDIFQYAFCFAGVLIGPYYKFRTYMDSFYSPYFSYVPFEKVLHQRIKNIPVYIAMYLAGIYFFPLEFTSSKEMLETPFWFRLFYMTPIFFNFRMRIYVGFILGECICMSFGLGVYPTKGNPQPGAGPTNYNAIEEIGDNPEILSNEEYSFESVKNIDEYGSEFLPTIREGIRSWNRTVQFWLATFIYKNINSSKNMKILATMLVSSIWHGVHPGYYLCLLSAPLFLIVEREVEKAFRKNTTTSLFTPFNFIWWLIKMQSFAYMGMAFLLLDITTTLHYWRSVYFIGHIFIVCLFAVARVRNTLTKTKKAVKSD